MMDDPVEELQRRLGIDRRQPKKVGAVRSCSLQEVLAARQRAYEDHMSKLAEGGSDPRGLEQWKKLRRGR